MKYKNQMVAINQSDQYLETKHQLKPIQNVLINFVTVIRRPWQTPSITQCRASSLNL